MKKTFLTFALLCFALVFVGCKETQYTYYDKANSKPKEVFEVDKETGKKDGKYKWFAEDGTVLLECSYKEGNLDAHKSTMTDSRDGKNYKTVKTCSKTWMAENLNYKTEDSYCYNDKESNCQKYGRLYKWEATKNACPTGWHLPSKEELETLIAAVGGKEVAGKKLKSTSGWEEYKGKSGNGDDVFGFSALPAGCRGCVVALEDVGNEYEYYSHEGNGAYFWSSTEDGSRFAYTMNLNDDADLDSSYKLMGFSVRCVKD